ncbi:LamG-like jellyroll fold domain-containing protein [Bacillus mobilis]|uniref:LamG-like jellyroll fold domain-containing protein n=1 Tax=Bacillus mobilis TaxID=2026190 RepID=UPI0036B5E1EF
MDIISYGVANKAKSSEGNLRNQVLATGVEGKSKNVKERIDALDSYFDGLTARANKLIVNDAVNIMKANARLNAIAKTTKYKMENMVFDDLLDASGIDAGKSSGYKHNTEFGFVESNSALACTVETVSETLQSSPEKVILLSEEHRQGFVSSKPRYGIKFDGIKTQIEMRDWFTWNTKEFTCELTVTLDGTSNQAFVSFNEDRIICGYYGNKVHLRLVNYTLDGISLQVGREYKLRYVIAFVDGKSYLYIYVDGKLVASGETTSTIPASAKYWSIGQEVDGGYYSDFAKGTMSDIRLWNKVIDTAGTELTGKEEGLMLYYDFAEGEGTIAIDKSPNKRDFSIKYGQYVRVDSKNIVLESDIQPTGKSYIRSNRNISQLGDGNKTDYIWDDGDGSDDGLIFTFNKSRDIGDVVIYAPSEWPIYGGKILADGVEVARTSSKFTVWSVPVNKSARKIEFIRTNNKVDQAITEVEIYESNLSVSESTEKPSYFISSDNGETWIPIETEKLFYFENGAVPAGTQLKVKAIIPPGYKLSNYALTWA